MFGITPRCTDKSVLRFLPRSSCIAGRCQSTSSRRTWREGRFLTAHAWASVTEPTSMYCFGWRWMSSPPMCRRVQENYRLFRADDAVEPHGSVPIPSDDFRVRAYPVSAEPSAVGVGEPYPAGIGDGRATVTLTTRLSCFLFTTSARRMNLTLPIKRPLYLAGCLPSRATAPAVCPSHTVSRAVCDADSDGDGLDLAP